MVILDRRLGADKQVQVESITARVSEHASIPKASINKAIGNMAKRCELLCKAKGGHFHEGGR